MAKPLHDSESTSAGAAARVFAANGLGPAGFWGGGRIPTDESTPDAGAFGLCRAIEQLGRIYCAWARFLRWRADLLPGAYVARLRRVRLDIPAVPRAAVAALIRRELGPAGEETALALSEAPEWNTPFRTAYLSTNGGQPVIVEVAHPPFGDGEFHAFERSLRSIKRPELAGAVGPAARAQFREYVSNGQSLAREQSFLQVLGRYRDETTFDFPRLLPDLCSESILCWQAVDGRPVSELLDRGDSGAPVSLASVILEQFFSLSLVDADFDLDAVAVDGNNRVHLRRLENPVAILPGVIDAGIRYVASVQAGDAARSAQALIRLMISQPPLDLEKRLMEEFSAVEPELKINMWFPSSAAGFESNWRALARIAPARPLFLDSLHRNLLAAGYWNADAVGAGAAAEDAISTAMWPAVRRLLRDEFDALSERKSIQEWVFGSGMLMVSAFRELNRQVEELRDNDITVGVDCGDWQRPPRNQNRAAYPAVLAVLLALFLAGLHWGGAAPEPWSMVLKVAAAASLPAMFWTLSKIQ